MLLLIKHELSLMLSLYLQISFINILPGQVKKVCYHSLFGLFRVVGTKRAFISPILVKWPYFSTPIFHLNTYNHHFGL